MIKGLEALREICFHLVAHDETQHKEFDEYISVIEKALKEYEELKSNYKQLGKSYDLICEELVKTTDKIACLRKKELKALEIIKENDVDIFALKVSIDLKQYNCKEDGRCPLTQKEYDLLREVLL